MNIGKYCKQKGMTKEEYIIFKNNIKIVAETIKNNLMKRDRFGLYYPTKDLFNWNSNKDMKDLIINELKKMNVEFINNNEEYRIID